MLFRFATAATQIVIVLICANLGAAHAQDRAGPAPSVALPAVEVSALRDPVEKSYRKIVDGMDLFEEKRHLAPRAPLRFKLLPRSRDTNMQGIALTIVGDTVSIPVDVRADSTFTLERSPRAFDEDASVMPNRRAGSMTWRADIRTPGLPPNTRRLGDLRLECLVGIKAGLVSTARSPFEQMIRFITDRGYCDRREPEYLFFAERPLWTVTLVHGSRREVLAVDQLYGGISRVPAASTDLEYCDCEVLLDRTYYAPLGDPSWPDDTLLEFKYMDDDESLESTATPTRTSPISADQLHAVAIGTSTKADVVAVLGQTLAITFDSGYEVWVYRLADEAAGESVVLFAPSGVVAKTRIRPAPPS